MVRCCFGVCICTLCGALLFWLLLLDCVGVCKLFFKLCKLFSSSAELTNCKLCFKLCFGVGGSRNCTVVISGAGAVTVLKISGGSGELKHWKQYWQYIALVEALAAPWAAALAELALLFLLAVQVAVAKQGGSDC